MAGIKDDQFELRPEAIAQVGGHALAAVKAMLKAQGLDYEGRGPLIIGSPAELYQVTVVEAELGQFNISEIQRFEV